MISRAQLYTDHSVSELISALQKNIPDSNRVQLYLQLVRKIYFERGDSKKSLDTVFLFLQKAEQLSAEIHSLKWQPEIFAYLGKYYYKTGDFIQADYFRDRAINYMDSLGSFNIQLERWKRFAWNIPVLDSVGLTRINCFEKMRSLYQRLGNVEKEIEMQREIADTRMKQGKLDLAEQELTIVLNRYKSIGFSNLHYTYNLLSETNHLKGSYDKALHYALLAIESMEKTKDSGARLTFYSNLAVLYHEMGQSDKSVEYHKILFSMLPEKDLDFYHFRSVIFYLSDLIKLGQKDEAGKFLFQFSKKYHPVDPYSKAILAKAFADYYNSVHKYELADKYTEEMINLEESLGKNNEVRMDIECDIGQYYFRKKQFANAAIHYDRALDEAILNNSANSIKDIHLMLFKADSSQGNFETAIRHLNKYRQLTDSIFTITKIKEAEEVQVKYETEKKVQNIKLLEQEKALQQNKLSNASTTRNWILGGTGLLLVIVVLQIYNARVNQRANKKLRLQQSEIEKQNISLRHLVNEKEWLLKEIHHRVKNNLQMVMSLLNSQSLYINNEPALTAIHDSQHRVHAMSLIHQKLYNSENLSSIDLSLYVRELASYLKDSFDTGERIHFEFRIEPLEMDVVQAVPLGLILNESITNSLKYAFPDGRNGAICISLSGSHSDRFMLSISDNGVGIPTRFNFNAEKPGSLGMRLIKGLSAELDGEVSIENNNGTTIRISFRHNSFGKKEDVTAEKFALNN
jgi:two-component sensor histidine kinase